MDAKINVIKKAIGTILNKNHYGVLTPEKFNNLISLVNMKIFTYFIDLYRIDDYKKKLDREGLSFKYVKSVIDSFITRSPVYKDADNFFLYPNDFEMLSHVKGVEFVDFKKAEEVEKLDGYLNIVEDNNTLGIDYGEKFETIPNDAASTYMVYYYKTPKTPKWTYIKVDNTAVFNPGVSDYQDIEFPASVIPRFVIELAYLFGIHLRESDVVQLMDKEGDMEYKQNIS